MINFIPSALKNKLSNLNINLNPPADDELINSLSTRIGRDIHPDIIALYKSFNGFANEDFDERSLVKVWTIERIVLSEQEYFKTDMMPFADYCLDLDTYCCSYSNPNLPVYSTNRRRKISLSYYDFWLDLVLCNFDAPM